MRFRPLEWKRKCNSRDAFYIESLQAMKWNVKTHSVWTAPNIWHFVLFFLHLFHSSAPSQHDAQLLAISHQADLFRLAVDQRYAHEYGDSCVTEDSTLAAAANSSSCSYSEASLSQGQSPEMRLQHTADWQKHKKTQLSQADLELRSADCMQTRSEKEPVKALRLKMYDTHIIFSNFTFHFCL